MTSLYVSDDIVLALKQMHVTLRAEARQMSIDRVRVRPTLTSYANKVNMPTSEKVKEWDHRFNYFVEVITAIFTQQIKQMEGLLQQKDIKADVKAGFKKSITETKEVLEGFDKLKQELADRAPRGIGYQLFTEEMHDNKDDWRGLSELDNILNTLTQQQSAIDNNQSVASKKANRVK